MTDRFTPEKRSEIMGRVRGKDTAPELATRKLLHRLGYRFRLHRRDLPGKPDIVLPRFNTALFVHGCFWHGHAGCKRATIPATRDEFWRTKIRRNQERDATVAASLAALGYRAIVLWQCELKDEAGLVRKLASELPRI